VGSSTPTPPHITLLQGASTLSTPLLTQRLEVSYGKAPAQALAPCKAASNTSDCRAVAFDSQGNDISAEVVVSDASICVSDTQAQAPCWPCDLALAQAGKCLPGRYNLSFSGKSGVIIFCIFFDNVSHGGLQGNNVIIETS